MLKKNICIVTGSRAEYGLFKDLCSMINKDSKLNLQLIVTGAHLSKDHGMTINEINKDKFKINKKVKILTAKDTSISVINSIGVALKKLSNALKILKPSVVVILGDRYEIFAASIASYFLNIPILHIHGGEQTQGSIDEGLRHSITKMSWLHFVATANYRKRVIQLGEEPKRVFNVGSLGVEALHTIKLFSKKELEKLLNVKFNKKNLLVTYHPETISRILQSKFFNEILKSLNKLKDTLLIFTAPNADPGYKEINKLINKFVKSNPQKSIKFFSLGQKLFLSTLNIVDGIVGNSSSGIIEAPSLKTGTINIGERQKGRDMASSIINCKPLTKDIDYAIKLIFSKKFLNSIKYVKNPYDKKYTSFKIYNKIKKLEFPIKTNKKFYDIKIN